MYSLRCFAHQGCKKHYLTERFFNECSAFVKKMFESGLLSSMLKAEYSGKMPLPPFIVMNTG
jgi:hypothetical protein